MITNWNFVNQQADNSANLYVLKDGCPKCKIITDYYKEHKDIIDRKLNLQIIKIDPTDTEDTNYQLLLEKHIEQLPVLLIGNVLVNFTDAMRYLSSLQE